MNPLIPVRTSAQPAFTRLDLLGITVAAGLLLVGLLPALAQARQKAARVRCIDRLHLIGRAFRSYAADHGDLFPMQVRVSQGGSRDYLGGVDTFGAVDTWRHFWVLSNELESPRLLVCPADFGRYQATNFADLAATTRSKNAAISYGIGTGARVAIPRMVLAADRSLVWRSGPVALDFNSFAIRGNVGTSRVALAAMLWEPRAMHQNSGNALRVDGSVHLMNAERMSSAFAESGDDRNNYAQPGKSASQ